MTTNKYLIVCKYCNTSVFVNKCFAKTQKYCSWKCYINEAPIRRIETIKNRIPVICLACGDTVRIIPSRVKSFKYCSNACHGRVVLGNKDVQDRIKRKTGLEHHRWKGGKTTHSDGYILLNVGNKKYFEHRVIMERHLGRKLSFNETVHHINGDKKDNRLENLELLSRSEHTKLHPKQTTYLDFICVGCGIKFTKTKSNTYGGKGTKYCSHTCFIKNGPFSNSRSLA